MKRNLLLFTVLVLITANLNAHTSSGIKSFTPKENENKIYLTIDADSLTSGKAHFKSSFDVLKTDGELAVIAVPESAAEFLSEMMHEDFNRCGGYMHFETEEEALAEFEGNSLRDFSKNFISADYTLNQAETVKEFIAEVNDISIATVIRKLSSFHNRYYQAQTGVDSQAYVKATWEGLTSHRKDAKVEYFAHKWKQPSVILTLKGSETPDEVVVIGGHADSIAGYFGGSRSRAPGADDNASGIATITETIRVLMDKNYVPKKTIKFMGYAAEEVGLRGSKAIAQSFKNAGVNVVGVMQLDMTNFNGSDTDINIITDYTNSEQNTFLTKLIDTYLTDLSWGYDKCGYACSDHASWHSNGFPASMPFETKKGDMNRKIHTAKDTIAISGDNALHAAKFAKLALSFLVELDR